MAMLRPLYVIPIGVNDIRARKIDRMAVVHMRSSLELHVTTERSPILRTAVISDIQPIKLLAQERAAISKGNSKEDARAFLLVKWQSR